MTLTTLPDARWLHAIAAAAFVAASLPLAALNAQGLKSQETVDRIVGSQVNEEQAKTTAEVGKVNSAIDRTRDNISTVRKTSKLDKVDIVFLTDAARSEGGPPPVIEDKVRQHQDDVTELRKEIEANALLFNAIDSRRVAAQDVIAVEFDDRGKIVIYAAAKPSD
ncbi:hypothetical protein [Mesorhizobium sp. 43Arga]